MGEQGRRSWLRPVAAGMVVAPTLLALAVVWPTVGAGGAAPAADTLHTLRSGPVTVSKTRERLELSIANDTKAARDVTLEIVDSAGTVVVDKTVSVAADRTATLAFDPGATGRFRARISVALPAEIRCDMLPASLSLVSVLDNGLHTTWVTDGFTHLDDPV